MGFPMTWAPHFFLAPIIGAFLLFQALPISYGLENDMEDFRHSSIWKELGSVLCFSLGYCLLGYYWIPYTLKEFGDIFFPFNYVLGMIFSLIIVPQYILFVIFYRGLRKLSIKRTSAVSSIMSRNLLLAFVLTLLETYTPQQFPAHLGHSWLQLSPYLGLTPILGAPFFSFISYWLLFGLLSKIKSKQWDFFAIAGFVIFLIANLSMPLKWEPKDPVSTNVRMVQGNVGNFMKLQSESGKISAVQEVLNRYFNLSTAQSNEFDRLDLVIWPETAYPRLLNSAFMKTLPHMVPPLFKKVTEKNNAFLLTGGYDKSDKKNNYYFETEYNTAFFFDRDGRLDDTYHKKILIPFGESLPFGPLNPYFAKVIKNISFFAAGKRFPVFKLDNDATFITAICYEILFTRFISSYLNSAKEPVHFLINLTNDSWYGDTSEPWQHKFLAHWRSLEFQIPIVRMTNTGVSSVLYPDGSESKHIPLFQPGSLDFILKTNGKQETFYQSIGFLGVVFAFLILTLISMMIEKLVLGRDKTFF